MRREPLKPQSQSATRMPLRGVETGSAAARAAPEQRRTLGNHALERTLQRRAVQAKLELSQPGDAHEREADHVADRVMRMAAPGSGSPVQSESSGSCSCASSGARCSGCAAKKRVVVQRRAAGGTADANGPSVPDSVVRGLGPGQPFDAGTRSFFESRFGHDFSRVRVHTGGRAEESARAVRALAFTVGSDIIFDRERYQPQTRSGQRLIAHELTHVLQQAGGAGDGSRTTGVVQRAETDTSGGCDDLDDTKNDVNERVNRALANARRSAGGNAGRIVTSVAAELGANEQLGRSAIEVWAAQLGASKVRLPAQSATKYAGVNYILWMQPMFPILNPTMRVNDVCIGSDKLGHFFQQGAEYLVIAHQPGKSVTDAVSYGEGTEAGGFGLDSTGVYSNADLEANRQGLRFYEDLLATPGMTFDIATYISAHWNEEHNPSFYHRDVGLVVWRNLLNGSWSGSYTGGQASGIQSLVTELTVGRGDTSFSGRFGYSPPGRDVVNGTITNGQIVHQANSRQAITGVSLEFDWRSGTDSGKGAFTSRGESELRGTWGNGGSRSDGGVWNMSKSRRPLAMPVPAAVRQAECLRRCEAEFDRCTRSSGSGGTVCLARRSTCFSFCARL